MNFARVIKKIKDKRNQHILISSHVRPDVDALASELALAEGLRSIGKKVTVINDTKNAVMYDFLPGIRRIHTYKKGMKFIYDLAIIVDCGDLNRIGRVQEIIDFSKPIINIDHHVTNDRFGNLNLVDKKASSTAEIIYRLLKKGRFKMTASIARLLYLGIMTDTGSFRYDTTTAETHRIVADLMRFKFSVQKIYEKIYESIPVDNIKLFTKIISNFTISHKGKVVSVELRRKSLEKFRGEFDLRDKIFSFLRSIKGVEVVAIFTEDRPNLTRVNFRSQRHIDVARLASFFGGGGHKRASGCTIEVNMSKAKKMVFRQLTQMLENTDGWNTYH